MKRMLCLALLCALCLAGCVAPATAPTAADPYATATPTPPPGRAVAYAAQCLRIGNDEAPGTLTLDPVVHLVRTHEDWTALGIDWATTNEAFFGRHSLLAVYILQSSCTPELTVTDVTQDGETLWLTVQQRVPNALCADLTQNWLLVLELPASVPDDVQVRFEKRYDENWYGN